MKRMISRRNFLKVSGIGAAALGLAACGSSASTAASSTTASSAGSDAAASTPQTITFYPRDANLTSGLVGGFKGEYFASRGFNVEVWAYSDEKTNAILASGDLPDVMFIPTKNVNDMIDSGMLLNLDDYLDQMPHVQSYEGLETALNFVRKFRSNDTGSVYVMPVSVGDNAARYQLTDPTERNAVKINWQAYQKAGCPEITSMDDLLDVTEEMLAAMPTADDGNPMYGTVLNSGSDTSYWACMVMWYRMQGYHEQELPYLLEEDMANGTIKSILSSDSMYYRGLKWYNSAYKRGLIDPDSISNDRATQKPKVDKGYTITPSGYLPGWATTYMPYYVPGTKIHYNYNSAYGNADYVIGINAHTQNRDACLKFIDMLADPDAYLCCRCGPKGEVWDVDSNGVASITDTALTWCKEHNSIDLGSYTLSSGEELTLWNTPWIVSDGGALTSYTDAEGNRRPNMTNTWAEMQDISATNEVYASWCKAVGYDSWLDWLNDKNAYVASSALDNIQSFESIPDDMTQLMVDSIKDVVTTASWKMVYAENDASFDSLWNQMVSDCEGLGAQDIIDWRLADIENAKSVRDSLAAD